MATIRIVLGIICLVVFGGAVVPSGDFLAEKVTWLSVEGINRLTVDSDSHLEVDRQLTRYTINQLTKRIDVIAIARSQLGVREATGKNDGKQVEMYLSYTGNKKGAPWCASFVSWVFGKAAFKQPVTAWSPALFPQNRRVSQPIPANVFGIYYANLKRIAHCGLVAKVKGNWIATIEGNTNVVGTREGDGVYSKLRHKRTISVYADWIN